MQQLHIEQGQELSEMTVKDWFDNNGKVIISDHGVRRMWIEKLDDGSLFVRESERPMIPGEDYDCSDENMMDVIDLYSFQVFFDSNGNEVVYG
jgi:hypothetical protein